MSKDKIVRIICIALLVILIIVAVAFYVIDIVKNDTPADKNLFKMLAAVFICLGSLTRFVTSGGRRGRNLSFYETQYSKEIGTAFSSSPAYRRRLLSALKMYNENKMDKAVKVLMDLRPFCQSRDDYYAVWLFLGLCLTDMGLREEAVTVYNQMIEMRITTSTVYGNLGSLYSALGKYDDAIASLRLGIQNDEKNPAPYNNLAKLYFDTFDFENAKAYAKKALEINHKYRTSASLLAEIYSLEGDEENAAKYSHIAISAGESPERLKRAIEYYKSIHSKDD
ncbi:MAG: tetratricopeptide repeat protein [Clostridia bacterium]|nr:tetratricopeptide repeat protein [Clostridia bacterium]